mgnify:CR=1 FL=1
MATGKSPERGTDARGRDKQYQHMAFWGVPWDKGVKTLWAEACAPDKLQMKRLCCLKLIAAIKGCRLPPGGRAGLVDLVTQSNKAFNAIVGEKIHATDPPEHGAHEGGWIRASFDAG